MGRQAHLKAARRADRRVAAALRSWIAGNLPYVRNELVRSLGIPPIQAWVDELSRHIPERSVTLDVGWRDIVSWAHAAELYFVTESMSAVVEAAARSTPPFVLGLDEPPAPAGLVVWAKPPVGEDDADQPDSQSEAVHTRAVLWKTGHLGSFGPGVAVIVLCDTEMLFRNERFRLDTGLTRAEEMIRVMETTGPLSILDAFPVPLGVDAPDHRIQNRDLAALISTWRLMNQRIAVTTMERPSPASRGRLNHTRRPDQLVHSITLRRAGGMPTERADGQAPTREYHHQWMVTGHWRSQTHLGARRPPIYIAEHIKGPDGAPFVGGERVAVLRR